MNVEKFLQDKYNYNPEIKDNMKEAIVTWKSWYEGNVRKFHNYYIYQGKNRQKQHRYTLNMAKEVSEDWSDILWSEKCVISLKSEESQKKFEDLINELNLYVLINQAIEKSGALGTEAAVVSVYNLKQSEDGAYLDTKDAKTRVDLVDVDWIFPLTWNAKGITECAFGCVEYIKGDKYIILSVHKKDERGIYHIYNHLLKETEKTLTEVENQKGTVADFNTQSDTKWFSIFKPLLTNNLYNNNPFGIPHFANAIDNLKAVDMAFDALKNEVKDGRKRTFVRADMLSVDADGTQKMTFDPEDITIYQLPDGATKDDLIQSDTEELRTDKLIGTLNTELNLLGSKVGFGENHYHFDGTNLSTATAVVSSNSKLFRRKKKLEIGYEDAIYDLTKAILYASSKYGSYKIKTNDEDISILFDDSIIEDKDTEANRAMMEVSKKLLSRIEYRVKIFGETEEIAKQKIKEIDKEEKEENDKMMEEIGKKVKQETKGEEADEE